MPASTNSLASDDQMVDHREVDRFPGKRQAASDLAVGGTGGGVAAGVVMGQDHSRAAVGGGVGDDLAQGKGGPTVIAVVARQVDAAGGLVDMGDPQMFALRIGLGEAVGEEAAGRVITV